MPSSQTTCWPSSMYLSQLLTDAAHRKQRRPQRDASAQREKRQKRAEDAGRAGRSLSAVPGQRTTECLLRWMGTARWTYNHCLEAHRDHGVALNKKQLRAKCINQAAFVPGDNLADSVWALETHYDIHDEAMNDLIKAVEAQCTKIKKKKWTGKQAKFTMAFLPSDKIRKALPSCPNTTTTPKRVFWPGSNTSSARASCLANSTTTPGSSVCGWAIFTCACPWLCRRWPKASRNNQVTTASSR